MLVDALLVHAFYRRVDALDRLVSERVPTEGQLEIVRGDGQHTVDSLESGVVDLVQANIEVLELRVDQQEPVGDLGARIIPTHLRLKVVKERHSLLWLLRGFELLVLLHDGVTLLNLALISLDLIRREGLTAEALEQGDHICR